MSHSYPSHVSIVDVSPRDGLQNESMTVPTAIKQVFWRISIFYIASLTVVGLLVPYDEPRLLTGDNALAAASPFVIVRSADDNLNLKTSADLYSSLVYQQRRH